MFFAANSSAGARRLGWLCGSVQLAFVCILPIAADSAAEKAVSEVVTRDREVLEPIWHWKMIAPVSVHPETKFRALCMTLSWKLEKIRLQKAKAGIFAGKHRSESPQNHVTWSLPLRDPPRGCRLSFASVIMEFGASQVNRSQSWSVGRTYLFAKRLKDFEKKLKIRC